MSIDNQTRRIENLLIQDFHTFMQGAKDIDLAKLDLPELERLEGILKALLISKDELEAFESDHLADIK